MVTRIAASIALCGLIAAFPAQGTETAKSGKAVQVDLPNLLDCRPVTTFTSGSLVGWTKGVDAKDGYLTNAAALAQGDTDPHALPDDALIPAAYGHPAIQLHYSNDEAQAPQARCMSDAGEFSVNLPHYRYSDLYFALTSAVGPSTLTFDLTYTDGVESRTLILPDWYNDVPEHDAYVGYVVHDLAKWNRANHMAEKNHHNIDALHIYPDPHRTLVSIKLKKGAAGYLVFWGLTGIAKP